MYILRLLRGMAWHGMANGKWQMAHCLLCAIVMLVWTGIKVMYSEIMDMWMEQSGLGPDSISSPPWLLGIQPGFICFSKDFFPYAGGCNMAGMSKVDGSSRKPF